MITDLPSATTILGVGILAGCELLGMLLVAVGVVMLWRGRKSGFAALRPIAARTRARPAGIEPGAYRPARLLFTSPTGSRAPIDIPVGGLTIGRDSSNRLAINDVEISRCHARVLFSNGAWFVLDLGSANGTFVNGERATRQVLKHGDQILVGQTLLVFQVMA